MPYRLPVICTGASRSQFLKNEMDMAADEVAHFVEYLPQTTDSILALQIYTNALEDYIHQL